MSCDLAAEMARARSGHARSMVVVDAHEAGGSPRPDTARTCGHDGLCDDASMTPHPADTGHELDALAITIVVDNVTDTLSSIGPGLPQLPELAYAARWASRRAGSTTAMTAWWPSTTSAWPVTASLHSPPRGRGNGR